MSRETFEHILSNPTAGSDSGALSAAQFTSADAGLWRNLGRPATVSDNASVPSFADAASWPQIQPVLAGASSVDFVGADHDPKVVPDFILGKDGKLRPNPAKTEPSPDGKITIEVENSKQSEIAAAKLSNENQKAGAREMIAYIQKNNPKAGIPQYLLDILNKQPDLPSGGQSEAPRQRPQAQPDSTPPPSTSSGGYDGGSGSSGGGGGGGGSSGGGYRGGGEKAFDPGERPRVSGGDRPVNPAPVAGDMVMAGPPTITPEKIDQVLRSYNSPAAEPGMGKFIYDLGVKYGIDPAVAVAFFVQESTAGTAGVAARTHSWGNIIGEGPAGHDGRFRAYHNFREGAQDWFRLIHDKYLAPPEKGGFGAQTLSQVISHYAPSSDGNNERAYVANVKGLVTAWAKDDTRKNTASA